MQDISKKITHLRLKSGYTQLEVAEKLGVSKGFVSHVETGRYLPTLPKLSEWFGVFGYDLVGVSIKKRKESSAK